ncbi:MAG: hypothetical protein P9M13_05340 [Candidatus Ancaeobacter aquaticus]|nr:hypothetical protein [Candidatus Ancaeobacter aquaticus]
MADSKRSMSSKIIKELILPGCILVLLIASYIYYKIEYYGLLSNELQLELVRYETTFFILFGAYILQKVLKAVASWYHENIALKTQTSFDNDRQAVSGR